MQLLCLKIKVRLSLFTLKNLKALSQIYTPNRNLANLCVKSNLFLKERFLALRVHTCSSAFHLKLCELATAFQ